MICHDDGCVYSGGADGIIRKWAALPVKEDPADLDLSEDWSEAPQVGGGVVGVAGAGSCMTGRSLRYC